MPRRRSRRSHDRDCDLRGERRSVRTATLLWISLTACARSTSIANQCLARYPLPAQIQIVGSGGQRTLTVSGLNVNGLELTTLSWS